MRRNIIIIFTLLFCVVGCNNNTSNYKNENTPYIAILESAQGTGGYIPSSQLSYYDQEGNFISKENLKYNSFVNLSLIKNDIFSICGSHIYQHNLNNNSSTYISFHDGMEGGVGHRVNKTYHDDLYFIYNFGYGESYYNEILYRNDDILLEIEGQVDDYFFIDNKLYVFYNHVYSSANDRNSYYLIYDLDTNETIGYYSLQELNEFELVYPIYSKDGIYILCDTNYKNDDYFAKKLFLLSNNSIKLLKEYDTQNQHIWYDTLPYLCDNKIYILCEELSLATIDLDDNYNWSSIDLKDKVNLEEGIFEAILSDNTLLLLLTGENCNLYEFDIATGKLINELKIDLELKQKIYPTSFYVFK